MGNASLYAPVGEGILLSMECTCGEDGCASRKIYDDWTTEIYMEPLPVGGGLRAFSSTEIKNIFHNSSLNISRSNPNYVDLNTAYRALVFLNGCNQQSSDATV